MIKKLFSFLLSLAFLSSLGSGLSIAENLSDAAAVFSDSAVKTVGSGLEVSGTDIKITSPGTYTLSGECSDGSVTVKKGTSGVTIILSGLTLTSKESAPICINKGASVTLTAEKGTVNTLSDTEKNNSDNYPDNENAENAVIKCKDGSNVTVNGTGKIVILANGKNGIKSGASTDEDGDASLTLSEASLTITAPVNDAINAESDLYIKSGTLEISAKDDAIHSDGLLSVGEKDTDGPTVTVSSCYEGLEGADIKILSGNIRIRSEDDGINAANSDLSGYAFSLEISGGNISVDAEKGDGIDSNGTLTISGGNVTVFSTSSGANSPLDSDGTFKITGGTVLAVGNSSMAQNPVSGSQNFVSFGSGKTAGGQGNMPRGGGRNDSAGFKPSDDAPFGSSEQNKNAAPPEKPGQRDGGEEPGSMNAPGNMSAPGRNENLTISAGDTLSLTLDDETLFSVTAKRSANYVFYSSPSLSKDETYSFNINGEKKEELKVSESFSGGSFSPGGKEPEGFPQQGSAAGNKSDVTGISILEILKRFFSFMI